MTAHGTRIWIVITDGVSTCICSSHDGIATPITAPYFHWDSGERDVMAYKAWFKAERQTWSSQNPRRQHLVHIGQVLLEGARAHAYEALLIIAGAPIAAQLENELAPETRALLIGKIIQDYSGPELEVLRKQPEIRH
jgi:hypothetical protein